MQYRKTDKIQDGLSVLGYGCMRFSKKGAGLDFGKAARELDRALERGVNYFDTAYIYGGSEQLLGRYLTQRMCRDRMLIATKMPHYMCKGIGDFDRIFDEQLKRLQTDYVDYYLMHMITGPEAWERCAAFGVPEWIERKRAEGRIRHIGFSYHGGRAGFQRVVDAYPWEFCQIQLNYLDATSQAGLDGLFYAAAQGLPVIVMEPLRGGRLANGLPKEARVAFAQENARRAEAGKPALSPAQQGIRWLLDLPEVTCVLSGMNDFTQIDENCDVADEAVPNGLTDEEHAVFDRAVAAVRSVERVPCTGCGYCLPCPAGLDIPTCFRSYNESFSEGYVPAMWGYVQSTALTASPSGAGRCMKCGRCARHCPQGIDIPGEMDAVARRLEGIPYRAVTRFKGVVWKS